MCRRELGYHYSKDSEAVDDEVCEVVVRVMCAEEETIWC